MLKGNPLTLPLKNVFQVCGCGSVCVVDGWLKQPPLTEADWSVGLGEAAHQPSPHTLWGHLTGVCVEMLV